MPTIVRRAGRYRVQFMDRGKRRSKTFKAQGDARRFLAHLELGVADTSRERQKDPTFAEFAERWLKDYCQETKAPSQWLTDGGSIKNHLVPLLGPLRLTELKRSHLLAVQIELKRKRAKGKRHPLGLKTVNNTVALAKTMLATAVQWDLLTANPWQSVKMLKLPARRPEFWTPEVRDRFLELAEPLDPPFVKAVTVACHTGLRLGEIAALTKADVDFERGIIRVTKSLDVKTGRVGPTKNRDVADVPVNKAARAALEHIRFLQEDALVFDTALFWSARKRLRRLCDATQTQPIRFHDLRHTFASCLAMAGVDLLQIQILCRHKSYAMTLRYAHLRPDHLKGVTDVLCTTAPNLHQGSQGWGKGQR